MINTVYCCWLHLRGRSILYFQRRSLTLCSVPRIPKISLVEYDCREHVFKSVGQISLAENVLDILPLKHGTFLIAVDTFHEPWSMKSRPARNQEPKIVVLKVWDGSEAGKQKIEWTVSDPTSPDPKTRLDMETDEATRIALNLRQALQLDACHHVVEAGEYKSRALYSTVGDFLYGQENLRKRVMIQNGDAEGEDGADPETAAGIDEP